MNGIWDNDSNGVPIYTVQGNWNANTNTPDLTTVTQAGYAWIVNTAGNYTLGGLTSWLLDDIVIKTQTGWARSRPTSATWGAIGGTLSNQTDLQNALNLKATTTAVSLKQDKPTSAIENNIATFDSNKDSQDSGKAFSTSIGNPGVDTNVPTEKAVRTELLLKQDKPATAGENNIAIFDANKSTKDSTVAISPTLRNYSSATDNVVTTEKGVRSVIHSLELLAENSLGNGVKKGFAIAINTDTTKINIGAGEGIIIDNTNPDSPIVTPISYIGASAISLPYLATANATFLGIDATGTILQQTTEFTPTQRRNMIVLGAAIHSNRLNVNVVNNLPDVALSSISQFNDLADALRNFNVSGNEISANGSNLYINKSAGYIFKKGSNFYNDTLNPHTLYLAAQSAPSNLRYRLRDGTEYSDTANIDPNNYDEGGVLTAVPTNSPYTIQRVVLFPSNLIRIQYGQAYYKSKAEAIQGIGTEVFTTEYNMAQNGLLRAVLVVKRGTTDLSSTDNRFFEADRFGSIKLSAGGTSVTTLQQAYLNTPTKPQIVTNNTFGSIQLKRGSAADTDLLFEAQDGAGNTTLDIKGNGNSRIGDISGGNYAEIDSGGFLTLNGSGVVYEDLQMPLLASSISVLTAPSLIKMKDNGSGSRGVYAYSFSATTINDAQLSTEIPHSYKEGTDIEFHVHWYPETAGAGNVVFELEYVWVNMGDTMPNTTVIQVTAAAPEVIGKHMVTSLGVVPGAGKKISSGVTLRIARLGNNAADSYTGEIFIARTSIHFQANTLGSRTSSTK